MKLNKRCLHFTLYREGRLIGMFYNYNEVLVAFRFGNHYNHLVLYSTPFLFVGKYNIMKIRLER